MKLRKAPRKAALSCIYPEEFFPDYVYDTVCIVLLFNRWIAELFLKNLVDWKMRLFLHSNQRKRPG